MKTKLSFSKGKKQDSSMMTRNPKFGKTEKAKFPALADKIIEMSDIILEVLDSRFAEETRNYELEEMIKKQRKRIVYVMNKSDLADIKKIREETSSINPRVFVSCIKRKGGRELRDRIKIIAKKIANPVDNKLKKITVGIIGYPNTGKSSVINFLTGKPAAGVGADAGFTKGIQKVNLTSEIVLIDSPGVISRESYSGSNVTAISKHVKVGARSYSQVKNPEIAVANLVKEFPELFDKFYEIKSNADAEILIEKLGRKKGFLKKGGEVDEDKTSRFILKDWQKGKIRV